MESKDLKTITIHQGQGDDELEMTVQVTQAEFDKMEEIRSKDPLLWDGKELDLVKAAKEAIRKETSEECIRPSKQLNWKLLVGVVLGVFIIAGVIIYAKSRNRKPVEANIQSAKIERIDKENINEETRNVEESMRKIYDKLVELGVESSYTGFVNYFETSYHNRQIIYATYKEHGYNGTYKEFVNDAGYNCIDK